MKHIFKSLLYTAFSLFEFEILMKAFEIAKKVIHPSTAFSLSEFIRITFIGFLILFFGVGIVVSILLAISHIVSYFIALFAENRRSIFLSVDQDNYIRNCFVELANGKKVPVYIKRINVPTEIIETVNKEEDKEIEDEEVKQQDSSCD